MSRMGRLVVVAALAAGTLALSGCGLVLSILGFGTNITSFRIDGIVGSATIDPVNHSVTATVVPEDITALVPDVGVSNGATVDKATLQDGQPVVFTVRGLGGNSEQWNVTVNVQYGVSFTFGSTLIVLTHGATDSNGTYNSELGNDVPSADADTTLSPEIYITANNPTWDVYTDYSSTIPPEYVELFPAGTTAGTYGGTSADYSTPSGAFYNAPGTVVPGFNVTVAQWGGLGGMVTGTFSGQLENSSNSSDIVAVSGGYYKVKRIVDNANFDPYGY